MKHKWVKNGLLPDLVSKRFDGFDREWGPNWALEVYDGKKLAGGAIFHDYQPSHGTIELSILSENPRWMSRQVLTELGQYAFKVAGVQAVIMRMSEHNERAKSIARRCGFTCNRLPRVRGRNEDEIFAVLTDDKWRAEELYRHEGTESPSPA